MEAAIEMFAIDPKNAETVRILFQSGMPPEAFAVIGTELIREDLFRASMYGMDAAAKAGRMPDDFVSACYSSANDKMREELILFAERQLADRECVPLRDFLIRQCFIEKGVARREAWGTMSRLCHRDGYQSVCPFRLETKAAERIFGSMDSFLSLFIAFFRDPDWRKDNVICHRANRFLYDASDEVWASIAESASAHELVSTIVERIDTDTFCFLEAALIGLAAASPRMRPGIEESLRRIALNYRFHALAEYALQRIEQLTGRPADTQ